MLDDLSQDGSRLSSVPVELHNCYRISRFNSQRASSFKLHHYLTCCPADLLDSPVLSSSQDSPCVPRPQTRTTTSAIIAGAGRLRAPLHPAGISACFLPARDLASSAAISHRCPPRARLATPNRQHSVAPGARRGLSRPYLSQPGRRPRPPTLGENHEHYD